ncbi:hypothetical protein GGE16_004407 [Rhizobium leguminosarum]|uniref:Transmembrane protein n=2 Tax=Rhizobium/Agrobacterium group TaxID=227290 RepID=A0AAE2SXW9_RHILE|nr:hypothetical protein [Rhizobium leguminosarum]MBB4434332.1 hypothetical protein [Rhizobium esperanzae]MBB4299880.1 hypothetical protein [Rhizobium leguminosarum]MBB4309731.1 hypothetical protein [Rhizobium leguminosarum]MBB4419529.1 hypothetical protein [Rhizobium leguminosarum]
MTDCETLTRRQDMVTLHVKEDETAGLGERDYVEHVTAQKLSGFERVVVVAALALLSFVGFAAYSSSETDPVTTSAIAATSGDNTPHHQPYGHCRESSPYAERVC